MNTGGLFSKPVLVSSAALVSTLSISASNGFELLCSPLLSDIFCSSCTFALLSTAFSLCSVSSTPVFSGFFIISDFAGASSDTPVSETASVPVPSAVISPASVVFSAATSLNGLLLSFSISTNVSSVPFTPANGSSFAPIFANGSSAAPTASVSPKSSSLCNKSSMFFFSSLIIFSSLNSLFVLYLYLIFSLKNSRRLLCKCAYTRIFIWSCM